MCALRWWIRGDGGGAEQWEGDVCVLLRSGPQLRSSQICPHQLGETQHTHVQVIFEVKLKPRSDCAQTGEGVKHSRKGVCANHVSSMANFLKVGDVIKMFLW